VSEELSYSSEVSSPLSDDSPGQQLINADNTEQEDKGEDVEEETTALSISNTDHTSLSSRPQDGSPSGEVSTGCVNTEEEDGQGDDGESTSEELGTSVPCTEKTLQGAELVADGNSCTITLQSEFHSIQHRFPDPPESLRIVMRTRERTDAHESASVGLRENNHEQEDQFSPIKCSEDSPKSDEMLSNSDAGMSIASRSFYKTEDPKDS
jgi:hypothetical protein